jgi:hypothetical protein
MRICQILPGIVLSFSSLFAAVGPDHSLDSNTAFYEGKELNYIIPAPNRFKMIIEEAAIDGYSFAFIPDSAGYADAEMMVGVNIYKIRGLDFDQVIARDTASMRKHFGREISIFPVDSIFNSNGQILPTFYLSDQSRFIPTIMISYYNSGDELIIFELVITESVFKAKAEDIFMDILRHFKTLMIGDLGAR